MWQDDWPGENPLQLGGGQELCSGILGETAISVISSQPAVVRRWKAVADPLGLFVEQFPDFERFLAAGAGHRAGCLVVDASTHGVSIPDLLGRLADRGMDLGVIIVAAEYDAAAVVQAIKAGAVDFLEWPCRDRAAWERALHEAVAVTARRREQRRRRMTILRRLSRLSDGERDVLQGVLEGRSNRQMAAQLGISLRAVEHRRSRLMKKLRAKSVPDLVRTVMMAEEINRGSNPVF